MLFMPKEWMALARISLPVPLSPSSSTGYGAVAAALHSWTTARNLGAFADKVLKRVVALKAGPYKIFRLHFGDIAQLDLGQVLGQVAHQLLADIVHIGVAQHAQGPHHAALPEDGVDVLQTAAALNHIELVFDGRAGAQHLLEGGTLSKAVTCLPAGRSGGSW